MQTLEIHIDANDNAYQVEYCPHDHEIEEVLVRYSGTDAPIEIEVDGLYVADGEKFIPLMDALLEAAAIQYAEEFGTSEQSIMREQHSLSRAQLGIQ